jgi:hypothetical protein
LRATLPGFVTVPPVLVPGCTAILLNDGVDLHWVGCPTNSCSDPLTNPCQAHIDPFVVWCECDGGVLCRGVVWFNVDGSVQGRQCVNVNCGPGCTTTMPPAPLPDGNPAYFYVCDC